MKKIVLLSILILLANLPVTNAKIVWDFAGKGFSAATIANLTADNTRWTVSSTSRIVSAVTMSGELTANGVIIPETAGIQFGSTASTRINIDHGYTPPRLNLSASGVSFSLPGLVGGQKITIVTMTANNTSSRGINCTSSNATRLSGDATSLLENTNVFEVNATVTDPANVTFATTVGGVHIRSIMVEGNEVVDPDAMINIAYLFDSSYGDNTTIVGTENDVILQSGLMQKNVYPIDLKNFTSDTAKVFTDSLAALEKYNVVVVTDAISETHPFAKKLVGLINRVPMLNLKASLYNSDSWNLGTCRNPSDVANGQPGVPSLLVKNGFTSHVLFNDIDLSEGFSVYNGTITNKNLVQGYTLNESSRYADDSLIASVVNGTDTINAIHKHGTDNAYMLIPLCSDALSTATESAIVLVYNAAVHLASTKTEVVAAIKPTISLEYQDGITLVSLSSSTQNATIHYTIDGSVPTLESPVYLNKLGLTDSCTVKAFTERQGYDNSTVSTATVLIKTKLSAPVVSISQAENGKTVTLSAADGSIYYTLNGAAPTATTGTLYSLPLFLKRPCVIKAIALKDGKLTSDVASDSVKIESYVDRNKTLVWADFYTQPSSWIWNGVDTVSVVNADVIAKFAYTPTTVENPNQHPTLKTVDFNNGFMVGSYGQRVNLQIGGVSTSGNYSPLTEADAGASDRAISFLTTNAGTDPTTGFLATTTTYTGPFDVVVWFTGAKGNTTIEKLEISVSASNDSAATWTVLDTMTSVNDKYIRKRVAYYDATAPVYVKLKSVTNLNTNSNMMIFDVKLMGEGKDPVAVDKPSVVKKTVVSTQIYTLTGIEVKRPVPGLNIIRSIYSDGSVGVQKILLRETDIPLITN
jgi:hypothetical protein